MSVIVIVIVVRTKMIYVAVKSGGEGASWRHSGTVHVLYLVGFCVRLNVRICVLQTILRDLVPSPRAMSLNPNQSTDKYKFSHKSFHNPH